MVAGKKEAEEEGGCSMAITIKQLKKEPRYVYHVKGVTPSYINTIRKFTISEVPTMAIDDVEFKHNDSILYDEIVAHRFGLIPLKTDLKSYNFKQEGEELTPSNSVTLTLKVNGPATIVSGDLNSSDSKITPVFNNIPVTELLEGQSVELIAHAVLGEGKNHVKWSPGLVYYKAVHDIKIINQPSNVKKFVKDASFDVFELKNNKLSINKKKLDEVQHQDLTGLEVEEVTQLIKKEEEFIFFVEPWGQLSHKEMIEKAIMVYNTQLDELAALVSKIK